MKKEEEKKKLTQEELENVNGGVGCKMKCGRSLELGETAKMTGTCN